MTTSRCASVPSLSAAVLIATVGTLAAPVGQNLQSPRDGGVLRVELRADDGWHEVARLPFPFRGSMRTVELPASAGADPLQVRLSAPGTFAAYLDSVLLSGRPAAGSEPDSDGFADRKLARADRDVLVLPDGGLVCRFDDQPGGRTLEVTARIVGEPLDGLPFRFPIENLYLPTGDARALYTYQLGEHRGALQVDGELADEHLAEPPLFQVTSRPVSGHPDADTWAWVRDDGERLFVALDFACDNTMDGDRDWAEVAVRVGERIRSFRVSVPERRWGASGFTSTAKAAWQHKVYEFAIPLEELGGPRAGQELQLAISAYGTAIVGAAIDLFTPEAPQISLGLPLPAPPGCSQGTLATPPPWSILGSQRDLQASAAGGSPAPVVATVAPGGGLVVDSSAGFGIATVVWDGVDDCMGLGTATLFGDLGALGSEVTIVAGNSGTQSASLGVSVHGPAGTLQALRPLPPGPVAPVVIPFSSFTPVGTADFSDVRAVVLEVDTTAAGPGAVAQVLSITITGPPVPIELLRFSAE